MGHNNDIIEETLSGLGTTHCTNGIAILRQVHQAKPQAPSRAVAVEPAGRRRRVHSIAPPQELRVEYIAGQRQGPQPLPLTDALLRSFEPHTQIKHSVLAEDFAWLLSRLSASDSVSFGRLDEEQKTPGWSAFNGLIARDDVIRPSTIGYLPVIPASPTELSTVYTLLKRSVGIAEEVKQQDIVIVLDQAIYTLAQEILFKHRQEFQRVVLCLGGFHVSMTMMAVIGKWFAASGLQSILV